MYGSVRVDMLHSASAVHCLGKDGIAVFVVNYYEVIIRLTGWSDESSSLI